MKQIHKHLDSTDLVNQIRLLLYKRDPKIFDKIDFDNLEVYKEPLLYAFFNSKKEDAITLDHILIALKNEEDITIKVRTDEYGRLYFPSLGWFETKFKKTPMLFHKEGLRLTKLHEGHNVDYRFEEICYIKGTKIELLKHPISLLQQCYYNVDEELIDVEITNITKVHIENITKAYHLIKKCAPEQYALIEKYAGKCVIFNVDTYERNSFADMTAHGIGFYNAYQKEYDEVFFVDDIAHQTGHVILNTILFDSEVFFRVDKNTVIETIKHPDGTFIENRDLFIIYHALYTYYASFICLSACLENNVFKGRQKHEALGRIAFYINKCYNDLLLIDNPISSEDRAKEYMTDAGLEIFRELKNKWVEMYKKWAPEMDCFEMTNQPYNFTYSKFAEQNPLKEA